MYMIAMFRLLSVLIDRTTAKYGSGSGPVYVGYIYCDHSRDLSLVCTACGNPDIPNGVFSSFNGTVLTATCNKGYTPNNIRLICLENGTWSFEDTCKSKYKYPLDMTELRLLKGNGPFEGRVEIQVNSTWGTLCGRNFTSSESSVICRMLGYQYEQHYTSSSRFGKGTGPVYIENLECDGHEPHLNNCSYDVGYSCSHSYDAGVVCTGYHLNITGIRLAGTPGPNHGRVEIEVNNTWGTICHRNFYNQEARVTCHMLGLEYYSYCPRACYGQGSGPVYIDRLDCPSSATHINDCKYITDHTCQHRADASVICYGNHLNITGIRLAGTPGPYHGRVEIVVNNTWGTICDRYFSYYEAKATCDTLGLEYYTYYSNAYYGQGSGPVYIDRLECPWSAAHIYDCKYITTVFKCQHRDDVSVICYGPRLNITQVRLADSTGPYDGRAEIMVNDTWGTICDKNFNINDADTFCNMLGLRGAQYFTGARHGEGSGPVYVDEFFCSSHNTDLSDCKYLFQNSCKHDRDVSVVCNECGQPDIYYWDVGYFSYNGTTLYADCSYNKTYIGNLQMTCDNITKTWITEGQCQEYSYPLDIMDIRLAGGNRSSHGRVELKVMDTWGTVCDHSFGIDEANTICTMIGYAPAFEVYSGSYYGEGKGPIFVDDLNCFPGASHINNCTYVTYDNCQHSNDVSVICTGISFDHSISIDTDLPDGTNLDSAETFNTLRLELIPSLLEYFSRYTPAPIDIIINDIRHGSITVDYTIVYGKTAEDVASKLTKAVFDLEQGVEITINGKNVSASSDVYKDMEPCEVYQVTVGSCGDGYQCRAENSTPTCRLKEADTDVNWSLVIGLSGAGIFFVLLVTIIVVFLRHLARRQKRGKRTMPRERHDLYSHGLYGHSFDENKSQGWQKGNATDTEWRVLNWRNKLLGPTSFRSNEKKTCL